MKVNWLNLIITALAGAVVGGLMPNALWAALVGFIVGAVFSFFIPIFKLK